MGPRRNRSVLLRHIVGTATQQDIVQLACMFGDVATVALEPAVAGRGPKSQQQAIVEFEENEDAAAAVDNLDGLEFFGIPLRVSFYRS